MSGLPSKTSRATFALLEVFKQPSRARDNVSQGLLFTAAARMVARTPFALVDFIFCFSCV